MDHYEITATSCLVLGTWQGTYPAAFSDYYPTPSVFDVHGRNFGTDDCSGDSAPFSFTTAFFTITYGDADPANNFAWLYGDVGTYFYVDGHAWDPTVANITLANAHPCPGGITYDGQGGTITIGRFTC